jgi:DNA-directed RNA polymerase subunit RPC12/RpoP
MPILSVEVDAELVCKWCNGRINAKAEGTTLYIYPCAHCAGRASEESSPTMQQQDHGQCARCGTSEVDHAAARAAGGYVLCTACTAWSRAYAEADTVSSEELEAASDILDRLRGEKHG